MPEIGSSYLREASCKPTILHEPSRYRGVPDDCSRRPEICVGLA